MYIKREGGMRGYVRLSASEREVLNVKIHRCVYEVRVTLQLAIWVHYIRHRKNCAHYQTY